MPDAVDPIAAAIAAQQRQSDASAQLTVQTSGPPLDPIAVQIRDEQLKQDRVQQQLLQWRATNSTADAGKRADVLRYSAASNMDPTFVEENLDQVKKKVDAEQVNWAEVAHRQPSLVAFMLDRPEYTPVVKDDTANLGGIEWARRAPFSAFYDAVQQQRSVARQFLEVQGLGGDENRQQIRELEQQFANKDYGATGFFQQGLIGAAQMLPYIAGDVLARVAGGAAGVALGGSGGAAAGGAAGAPAAGVGAAPGSVAGGAAGAVGGGAVGQFVGSGLFNYYEAVGPLYWRLSNLKDSSGQPMDPKVARAFAQGGAVITAGLMAGFMGKVGGSLPGVKQLLAKFGANTVEKALLEQSTAQVVKAGVKGFGQHWLTGATMMAGQSAISAAAEESAKSAAGGYDVQWGNVTNAAKQGFQRGLTDMWLISAFGPGREMLKDLGRARTSAEDAVRLEAMTNSAAASKLLERFGPGFEEFVKRVKAESGAVENVYVPADEWTRYWQEQKLDPGQVAAGVIGDGGKAYAEAVKSKGDLVIPVEKYLSKLAKTEHAKGLEMDAKLRPEALTARQLVTERKALKARLDEQAKVRGAELDQGKKEVSDFIAEQAKAAGVPKADAEANGKLVSEYAGTLALRLGVSVHEAAALGSLGQLRILGPKGEAVAQAAREHFKAFLRPEASKLLEDRLATLSPENRAREYYLDQVSGLRNRLAFDATPAPEGKDQVAVLTSPDVKGINDHPTAGGHDVANELLRAMGKALSDRPDAARDGTSFLVHVKDRAELEQLVAKVKGELGNDKLNVLGELGGGAADAFTALDATTARLRGEKALPERGGLNPQLDVAGLKFKEGRAAGVVPEHLVGEVSKLSDVEYAQRAYLDTVEVGGKKLPTGLLSRQAWDNVPRKAHVASIDLKGLKAANEKYGKEAGNRVLFVFADVVAHLGGSSFDAAHLSGDEYAFQHSDPLVLEQFVKRVKERMKDVELEERDVASGKVEPIAVDFRHGIGRDYGQADRALNAAKRGEAVPAADQGQGGVGLRGRPGNDARQTQEAPGGTGQGQGVGEVLPAQGAGRPGASGVPGTVAEQRAQPPGPDGQSQGQAGRPTGVAHERSDVPALPAGGLADGRGDLGRGATRQGFGEVVTHVEGLPVTFHQEGEGAPRGEIRMRLGPDGRPLAFDISVLNGDRSTLAHETAHFLSWSLHDVATSDLATPDLVRDYSELIRWAGYASPEERLAQTKERQALAKLEKRTPAEEARLKTLSAKEERISHGWEQYLAEGKAPSEGLQRVFSRFKDWLLRIYKGVSGLQQQFTSQYGENIGLSNDVRGVFDRLLAHDQALQQASADSGRAAVPPPLVTAAMSPAERETYRKALVDARLSAESDLARRTAELENGEVQKAREKAQVDVARELDQQPVYRAMRFLQRGELVDAQGNRLERLPDWLTGEGEQPLKVNRKGFVQTFGEQVAKLMPPGIWASTKKGGVDVEQLAPLLDFEDGQHLVDALRKAEPRDKAIANQVQDRLDQAYGPQLQRIADAAMSAVHNYDSARATLLELRAIAKGLDPAAAARVRSVDLRTLKASAERLVTETTVDALDPAKYARVERATALKAAELWGRGDKEKAAEQLEARLFNQLLYRAARDAKERLDKLREKLEGTSDEVRGKLGKGSPLYRDVHDALLAAVGLGEKPAGPEAAAPVDQLVQLAGDSGQEIDFDVGMVRELLAKPRDWGALTVDQAVELGAAAKNIRHLAGLANELELGAAKESKDKWFADYAAHLKERTPLPQEPLDSAARTFWQKAKSLGRGADAALTDVAETYAHMLDGGDRNGPVHRLLVDARLAAREKALELNKRVLLKIQEKWDEVPKDIRKLGDQRVDVAELLPTGGWSALAPLGRFAPVYTRGTLWMLFLNWGNEGNRQRVRDGMGWSDDNVMAALSLLSKPELKYLQGVLDTVNSLFPEIAAVHEKRTGLPLGKVESAGLTLNGEQYAGGYFPLKYKSELSRQGEVQEGQLIKDLFAPNYVRPVTSRSHTKERAAKVSAVVDLSWGVVPAHLSQVIHDIAYGDWVRQAGGVLLDPRFKELAALHLGQERAAQFVPWLRDVANARADSGSASTADFTDRLGAFARNRAAVAVMGMNLPSILGQVLDPWNSAQENVPARHIASAYVKVNMAMAGLLELPELQLSKELAYRDSALKTNLREQLGKMGPSGRGIGRAVSETAFALYELSDHYTSRVTWKAAFDAALSDGLEQPDAAKRADDVVRRAYASHDIAEKPPLMRSKRGAAAAVMFYGFANRLYNSLRRSVVDVGTVLRDDEAGAGDRVAAVARLAAKLMMLGATGAAFSYIAGRGPKKDEDVEKWLAWRVALEPFNTVPFLGAALEGLARGKEVSIRTAPELAMLQDAINAVGHLAQAKKTEKAIAAAEALMGLAVGAPVGQLQRTGGYVQQLASGDARPRNPADVASGLLYGQRKDQGRNPLSDLADMIGR